MAAVKETFAGASITASQRGNGVLISVTLPSGKKILNADGWSDYEWDLQLQDAKTPADTEALTSLKASWSTLQANL
jgi:hypothetical protein